MNGNKIFADTNILIYFLNGDKEVIEMISDKDIVISFITELELLALPNMSDESLKIIEGLLNNCLIVDITKEIKERTIEIRKKSNLKLPDAIIAASAFAFNIPLITADRSFRTVDELEVIIYEL